VIGNPNISLEQLALAGQRWTMRFEQAEGEFDIELDNPVPVLELGTGCMVIRREVFQKLHAPFFDAKHDEGWEFIGEDVRFCREWRALGGKVWLAPWVRSTHVGTYAFPGDIRAISEGDGVLNAND
jgi:GT2 family glycosyltransferase